MAVTNYTKDELKVIACIQLAAATGIVLKGAPTGKDPAATLAKMQDQAARIANWADFIVEYLDAVAFAGDMATNSWTTPTPPP